MADSQLHNESESRKQGDGFKFIHGVKQHLSKKDRAEIDRLLAVELPYGYARTLYKCNWKHCDGRIQSTVYIPYGLSRGGGQNNCHCFHTDNGWPHREDTLRIGKQGIRQALTSDTGNTEVNSNE